MDGATEVRFRDNEDGTVTDTVANLMWQKVDDGIGRTRTEAESYSRQLALAGYSDWRLPTKGELEAISGNVDGSSITAVGHEEVPGFRSRCYWSASGNRLHSLEERVGWVVTFGNAYSFEGSLENVYAVRCVRSVLTDSVATGSLGG